MPKKRGNNEGTVSKRKDGRWCAVITLGTKDDGKPNRKFFYGKTRHEAAEKLNQAIYDVKKGAFVPTNKIKVSEWLQTWLFEYKKPSVRPSTFANYEMFVRVHLAPAIGGLLLKDLAPQHLQRLYNEKLVSGKVDGSGGLSAASVRYMYVVIHEALDQALRNNLVTRNVSDAPKLPQLKKTKVEVFTVESQMKFLAIIAKERLKAAFILALGTGVREGELLALRWQDVDLKAGTIRIEQSVRRCKTFDKDSPTKTILLFGPVKTAAGNRSIPLPAGVLTELKAHKKRQLTEQIAAGELWEKSGLVFTTELGKVVEPRNLIRRYYQLLKMAELKHLKFHAAGRHTFATRLLEANEHPKTVQEMLGHSSIVVTPMLE